MGSFYRPSAAAPLSAVGKSIRRDAQSAEKKLSNSVRAYDGIEV